jgi:hypothetical protein
LRAGRVRFMRGSCGEAAKILLWLISMESRVAGPQGSVSV